ncbi:MAG TPA: glycoside hydrolase family 11 protein [Polyangiaceae bacterium]|nr:glycoside hydrolase family 11 protein [Polyangiaceae bacterium]
MPRLSLSLTSVGVLGVCSVAALVAPACATDLPANDFDEPGTGGSSIPGHAGTAGGVHSGSGGAQAGSTASGGSGGSVTAGTGGATGGAGNSNGGSGATGGVSGAGSSGGTGNTGGVAGSTGAGGSAGLGGMAGSGGAGSSGGAAGSGGRMSSGGAGGIGGMSGGGNGGKGGAGGAGNGGSSSGSGGSAGATVIDCSAPMPTGGTDHCGQNTQGKAGDLSWSLWSNQLSSSACITTFSVPAFSARFSNNSDFLARVGLEWGNNGKPHGEYGTIKADFSYKKSGSAGGYSYIGIYGWTTNPCVEWYIVDDRWGSMPFNAYNASQKGTFNSDGADYKIFQNKTNGTGGSRCSGVSQWDQYWSIRQSARQCGTITVSQHFKAWEAAGLQLGGLLEAKILVESGGGTGDIEFPVANVTATQ